MPDIIDYLTKCYERMLSLQPGLTGCKIHIPSEVAKSIGWTEGQLLTKYNLPIAIDDNIGVSVEGTTYKTDIWVHNG